MAPKVDTFKKMKRFRFKFQVDAWKRNKWLFDSIHYVIDNCIIWGPIKSLRTNSLMSLNINNEYRRYMTSIGGDSLFDLSIYNTENYNEDEEVPIEFGPADISENKVREQMPDILDILLIDRTTSTSRRNKNIIWATENYTQFGKKSYAPTCEIKPELITGDKGQIIMPRALKSQEIQKERTKSKAEVFTPTWIVKKQNDIIDSNYLNDELETYVKRKWLEITCGEAPYMATRYDMDTGALINLEDRVGFVDRKLKRINSEVHDKAEWQLLVKEAYQSSYGFEWSGDSLLLARENLLYTYRDYYLAKWCEEPIYNLLKQIAEIISYNLFQMDGLQYIIPLSSKKEKVVKEQLSLFDENTEDEWIIKPGKRVKIMNWETKKMEFFDKRIK